MAEFLIQEETLKSVADSIRKHGTSEENQLNEIQTVDMPSRIDDIGNCIVSMIERTQTDFYNPNVDTVADFAFYGYSALKSVNFPNATSVGKSAFTNCAELTTALFPETTSFGTSAFTGCKKIENAAMGLSSVTSAHPFSAAKINLIDISIPYCYSIGNAAFSGCTSLEKFYAPLASTVPTNAFTGCTKLNNVTLGLAELSNSNHALNTIKSVVANISFPMCTKIYDVSNSVNTSGYVTAPNAIFGSAYTSLKEANFQQCSHVGHNAFFGCGLVTATFPSCVYIGNYAFASCFYLSYAEFPYCEDIGSHAFENCFDLEEVDFPKCEILRYYAFSNCQHITRVNLPMCHAVGYGAFYGCINISSATLGLTGIYNLAYNIPSGSLVYSGYYINHGLNFARESLQNITLPYCSYIEDKAFMNYTNLSVVNIYYNGVCKLGGSSVFYGTNINRINVPGPFLSSYKTDSYWKEYSNIIH